LKRSPETAEAFVAELDRGAGVDAAVDAAIGRVRAELAAVTGEEVEARRLVELLALTWQATLLVQHGDPDVASTFITSRLGNDWGREFGTLPASPHLAAIARRAVPDLTP